jgi:CMP-N,N'-diacetyllegionaminic acid synthase
MSNLAIIPARSGSKRLPNKNMLEFCGHPLLYWTIKAALESKCIDRVILSTDSIEIMEFGVKNGIERSKLRPDFLAEDSTATHDVVMNTLGHLADSEGYRPSSITLLQPTSPLRNSSDIDLAYQEFSVNSNADRLVSYTVLPESLHPSKIMVENKLGFLEENSIFQKSFSSTKSSERVFIRNGAAIYICKSKNIGSGILFGNILGFRMPWFRSVDIDTQEEFALAEALMLQLLK